MAPWQLAFIIVGLPGIILALLVNMRKEPERPPDHNPSGNIREGIGDALKFFTKKKWVYASFILPASVMTTIAYSQAWVPAMFERTWGMEAATYAYINGLLLLAFGPISNNGAGWLCDYWEKRVRRCRIESLNNGRHHTSSHWNSCSIDAKSNMVLNLVYH